jgi:D-arabinose 1-dehydrogenase-like Zn-dependent alcohol dehydrogenase
MSDIVRIGIIGCGGMARHHGRMFDALPGVQVAALAEPSADNLERFIRETVSDKTNLPTTYHDYRDMLKNEGLDGVVIVTPHTQHFQQTIDAMNALNGELITLGQGLTDTDLILIHSGKLVKHERFTVLRVKYTQDDVLRGVMHAPTSEL